MFLKRKLKKTMTKNKGGRPTVMTPLTIQKLEEVFALGGTDEEACFYADIAKQTLYDYQAKNPMFIDRKEALKETPILLARRTAVGKLSESYSNAMDYLSRKRKLEFSQRNELTGADGKDIVPNEDVKAKATEAINEYFRNNK